MNDAEHSDGAAKSQPPKTCFARRHMTLSEYGFYCHARAVSHNSGVFYSEDRRDAQEFQCSKTTINSLRLALEKAGWFVRYDKGPRRKHHPKTGQTVSIRYRILAHKEWIETHPNRCRVAPVPDFDTSPVPNISKGPVPDIDTGQQQPVPDSGVACTKKHVSPVPESGTKNRKERREEEAAEKNTRQTAAATKPNTAVNRNLTTASIELAQHLAQFVNQYWIEHPGQHLAAETMLEYLEETATALHIPPDQIAQVVNDAFYIAKDYLGFTEELPRVM